VLRGLAGRRGGVLTGTAPDRPAADLPAADRPTPEEERKRLGDWYIDRRTELANFLDDLLWELIVTTSGAAEEYYRHNDAGCLQEHADRLEALMVMKRAAEMSLEAINRSMENLSRMEEMNRLRMRRGK
jgi:hypothetical protein